MSIVKIKGGSETPIKTANNKTFVKNIFVLLTGSGIAQGIPIAFSLIMARLYLPESYGVFAIFLSVTGMLSMLVTQQYSHAILLPRTNHQAINVVALSCLFTLAIALVVFGLLCITPIRAALRLDFYSWLLPVTVALSGINGSLTNWLQRKENFPAIAKSRIFSSLAAVGVQLVFGILNPTPTGLVLGFLAGQFAATTTLVIQGEFYKKLSVSDYITPSLLIANAKKYQGLLCFATPSAVLITFLDQLPIYYLGIFFDKEAVGFLSFGNRVLMAPILLIAYSVGQVFQQRAVVEVNRTGSCRLLFFRIISGMFLIGLIPFSLIFFAGPDLFGLVFGGSWREAGTYAQSMTCLMYVKLITIPVLYVYYIMGREKNLLVMNVFMLLLSVALLIFVTSIYNHAPTIIMIYSGFYAVLVLATMVGGFYYSNKGKKVAD